MVTVVDAPIDFLPDDDLEPLSFVFVLPQPGDDLLVWAGAAKIRSRAAPSILASPGLSLPLFAPKVMAEPTEDDCAVYGAFVRSPSSIVEYRNG